MGKLIIHIDQDSGAVTKITQELYENDKDAMLKKEQSEEDNRILSKINQVLADLDDERAKLNKEADDKIKEWLESKAETVSVDLPILGDIYNDDPKIVKMIKEWRDTFDRIVPVPVEFWERAGNTICTIRVGGVTRRCRH